jgi:threonylcarbamoyladenosine tRNA methylthiotransferase MtaB
VNFYVTSLGCKLNQSEMEALGRRLQAAGHVVVQEPRFADWCVVNTCTVTHIAARKSRQLIRRLQRDSPEARIAVTGCYAEMAPEEIAALGGVDLVVSNRDKERLDALIAASSQGPTRLSAETPALETRGFAAASRTRAFVKIQDGCDNRCAYCITTIARGPQRSRAPAGILTEISARVREGYKEVVLTGVHIGSYGRDRRAEPSREGPDSLSEVVEKILTGTGIQRLRLSSIEPWDFDPRMLALWEDPRLCRHLHLPLQSGCDATLRRMARRYTTAEYAASVRMARQAIPGLALTTDLIVGFPGETDDEFSESLAFVKRMAFARLHVFKYSPRRGTRAATFADQVHPSVKQARSRIMIAEGARAAKAFARQFSGQVMDVLWENLYEAPDGSLWRGLTDNYIRAYARDERALHNSITPALLAEPFQDGLLARRIV